MCTFNFWKRFIIDAVRRDENLLVTNPEGLMDKDIADYICKNGYDIHVWICRPNSIKIIDSHFLKQTHKNGHVTV